jgi:serine/threonine protein kinase
MSALSYDTLTGSSGVRQARSAIGQTPTERKAPPEATRAEAEPPAGERSQTTPSLPEQFSRYRILRLLGRGDKGTVYLAHDTALDRNVALKIPQYPRAFGAEELERFHHEAVAAGSLVHPNICPVYDVGTQDGIPFLTMAYVEGTPLAALLSEGKPWPQDQAAALVRQLALAMNEAHCQGVVHRDLKPANIMIDPRGEPVIMDFGLARTGKPGETRLTRTSPFRGTPAYMAPEQLTGDAAVGPACDVYALGAILYELLTGGPPFLGSSVEVFAQAVVSEPAPVWQRRPDVDPRLEVVCHQAMARRPEDRFSSMAEFAAALEPFLPICPPLPAELSAVAVPLAAPTAAETPCSPSGSAPGRAPQAPWSYLVMGAALVIVGVLLGIALPWLALPLRQPAANPGGESDGLPSTTWFGERVEPPCPDAQPDSTVGPLLPSTPPSPGVSPLPSETPAPTPKPPLPPAREPPSTPPRPPLPPLPSGDTPR